MKQGATSRLVQRAGAVGVAAAIAVVGTVSAAGATTHTLGKTRFVFTSSSPAGATGATGAAAKRIICEMVFIGANHGAPHHSGHVPGTINVRVRVTCTQPIRLIRGKIGLFSNHGSKINAYGSVGRAAARGNAALVCRPGYYQGESTAHLVAPVGYTPPTANMAAKTAKVHITKC